MSRQTDTDWIAEKTPAFMRDDLPATEPKLDTDAIVVGTPVVVLEPSMSRRKNDLIPAQVTSKARVWIEATGEGRRRPWRLRLDTQDDGGDSSYRVRFYTPEQALFRTARDEAKSYLAGQGIRLDYASPWSETAATIRLVRMIWMADNTTETPSEGGVTT